MLPDYYVPRSPPFDHQARSLEAGWREKAYAFFLEMGMGKSRVAIDNFCLLYAAGYCDSWVIIAPKSVYTNWTRVDDENPGELQKWMWEHILPLATVHTYRAGKRKADIAARHHLMSIAAPGPKILVINKEAISATMDGPSFVISFLKRFPKSMITIDESTIIKKPKSIVTKECIKLAKYAIYKRILTGSPSTGSPSDLFSQFEFLGPGEMLLGHRSFYTFQARYCTMKEIVVAGGRKIRSETGTQNLDELAGIVAQHSFRRRKEECLDLPPKQFFRREVEITDEQAQAWKELKRTAMTVIQGQEVTTEIVLTQLTRIHQVLCGHIKTDEGNILLIKNNRIREMMNILEETDEQCVIWAMYRPDVEVVVRELRRVYGEDQVAEWRGGLTQEEREKGEADFQAGRKRFMVATKAGARGRTWTAATLVIYYSNDTDLEIREQSEDRTHRIGTRGTVTYIDLVIPNSPDEKVIDTLRGKKSVARAVLDEGLEAWI